MGRRGRGFARGGGSLTELRDAGPELRVAAPEPASRVPSSAAPPRPPSSSSSTIALASRAAADRPGPEGDALGVVGLHRGPRPLAHAASRSWASDRRRRVGARRGRSVTSGIHERRSLRARNQQADHDGDVRRRAELARRRSYVAGRSAARAGWRGPARPHRRRRRLRRARRRSRKIGEPKGIKVHGSLGFEHQRSSRDPPLAPRLQSPRALVFAAICRWQARSSTATRASTKMPKMPKSAPKTRLLAKTVRTRGAFASVARSPTPTVRIRRHRRSSLRVPAFAALRLLQQPTTARLGVPPPEVAPMAAEVFEVDEETSAAAAARSTRRRRTTASSGDDDHEDDASAAGGGATRNGIAYFDNGNGPSGRGSNRGWDSERNSARVPTRRGALLGRGRVWRIPRLALPWVRGASLRARSRGSSRRGGRGTPSRARHVPGGTRVGGSSIHPGPRDGIVGSRRDRGAPPPRTKSQTASSMMTMPGGLRENARRRTKGVGSEPPTLAPPWTACAAARHRVRCATRGGRANRLGWILRGRFPRRRPGSRTLVYDPCLATAATIPNSAEDYQLVMTRGRGSDAGVTLQGDTSTGTRPDRNGSPIATHRALITGTRAPHPACFSAIRIFEYAVALHAASAPLSRAHHCAHDAMDRTPKAIGEDANARRARRDCSARR